MPVLLKKSRHPLVGTSGPSDRTRKKVKIYFSFFYHLFKNEDVLIIWDFCNPRNHSHSNLCVHTYVFRSLDCEKYHTVFRIQSSVFSNVGGKQIKTNKSMKLPSLLNEISTVQALIDHLKIKIPICFETKFTSANSLRKLPGVLSNMFMQSSKTGWLQLKIYEAFICHYVFSSKLHFSLHSSALIN